MIIVISIVIYILCFYRFKGAQITCEIENEIKNMGIILILLLPLLYLSSTYERLYAAPITYLFGNYCNNYNWNKSSFISMSLLLCLLFSATIMNLLFYFQIHGNFYFPILINNYMYK